jgi:2-phosphosulfolactate phosphatase
MVVGSPALRRLDLTVVDSDEFRVQLEWGPMGLRTLAPLVDVVVIVDVLSFTTCVDVALGREATVFPYKWHDGSEIAFAESVGAEPAGPRDGDQSYSLAPSSLAEVPAGTSLVLPSPNGSALAFGAADAGATEVVAACVRNGAAVGSAYADEDLRIGVVAAGERWRGDTGPMRVAVEDLLGAGAVLSMFDRLDMSPDARAAAAAWHDAEPEIVERLRACRSGRELIERGWGEDVEIAAQAHVSDLVPVLVGDRFEDRA